jgi:hypothetical protein
MKRLALAAFAVVLVSFGMVVRADAGPPPALLRVSADPFTNTTSQHHTQVEPDSFSFGSTIVAAFQSGRFFNGGASDIGWATSTDNGHTWANGFLSGITALQGNGPYERVSDPSVAYDAQHGVWLIASLALKPSKPAASAVVVSRSLDGGTTWSANPATVAGSNPSLDKDWIVCDNNAISTFYGHCYAEYDDSHSGAVHMAVSGDGGLTWSEGTLAAGTRGIGGQPVVQPNGRVVMPYVRNGVDVITSNDGGVTYTSPTKAASIKTHRVAGRVRTDPLPSAEIDGAGRVYVAWQNCRFRIGCRENDIVMTTSLDGATWTPVVRIPIDDTTTTVDHFIPGLAIDATTQGSATRLALTYYFFPNARCASSTCQLEVGYISSTDGGASWSTAQTISSEPMSLSWLARTNQGVMVGDYISTSIAGGRAFPVFADAHAPQNGYDEAIATIQDGLVIGP